MRPQLPHVLGGFLQTIAEEIMPHIGLEYVQKEMEMVLLALMAATEESDRAAEVRVRENEDFRALFARAAEAIPDASLKARLTQASAGSDTSLRVTDLDAANDKLAALLIELHAYVEAADGDWAHGLNGDIWNVLRASTQRRAISVYPL